MAQNIGMLKNTTVGDMCEHDGQTRYVTSYFIYSKYRRQNYEGCDIDTEIYDQVPHEIKSYNH